MVITFSKDSLETYNIPSYNFIYEPELLDLLLRQFIKELDAFTAHNISADIIIYYFAKSAYLEYKNSQILLLLLSLIPQTLLKILFHYLFVFIVLQIS